MSSKEFFISKKFVDCKERIIAKLTVSQVNFYKKNHEWAGNVFKLET